jgi:hypothetical protein
MAESKDQFMSQKVALIKVSVANAVSCTPTGITSLSAGAVK